MKSVLRILPGLLLLALLGAGLATLPRWLAPSLYQSVARIRLNSPAWSGGQREAAEFDERHLATEVEIIRSETTLRGVLNDLGLAAVWGGREGHEFRPEEALARLRERVAVRPVPNTMLVEIHAASLEAAEAARIANAVAETYIRHQRDRRTGRAMGRLQTLRQEVEMAEAEVAEAQAALVKLREQLTLESAPSAALKIQEDLAGERFDAARRFLQTTLTQLKDHELEARIQPDTAVMIDQAMPDGRRRPWRGER